MGKIFSSSDKFNKIKLSAGAFFTGIISGIFGGGGGLLAVPLLKKYGGAGNRGLEVKKSHATSVFIILFLCIVSSIIYFCKGGINIADVIPYASGGIFGGIAGAFLLTKIPDKYIRLLFSIFMLYAGVKMISGAFK